MHSVLDQNYGPHLPASKQARILDLGCGSGRLLSYVASRGYDNVLGIDSDASVLETVPEAVRDRVQLTTDLSAFLAANGSTFDLIIAKDVLYYLPRDEVRAAMRSIVAALKPGGSAIVEVFNAALLTAPYTAAKDVGILTMYTERSLRDLLEGAGLRIEAVFGQALRPPRGVRGHLYRLATAVHHAGLRALFVLERGADAANPTLFTKSIIGVGRKPVP
jgi:SAM-dependent methyltransferase